MSDEKRLANELEKYLDDPERYAGALDQAAKQTANNLRKLANSEHPRPGFVNELAQQLREKDREMSENPRTPLFQRLLRLAFSGVALAAFLFIIVYATGLFRPPELEPAVQDMETPETVEIIEPEKGPFAGHRLQFAAELEDGPGEVALYRLQPTALPDTVEEAQELGRALGLQNPEVYETPQDPGRWIVRDESGANVSFRPDNQQRGAMPGGIYYSGYQDRPATDGEPLPFDEAARVATEFLEGANLLPDEYEVQEQPFAGNVPVRMVNIVPLINGLPLHGNQAPIQVGVLPGGVISHGQVHAVTATQVDQAVSVKSARQALDDLSEGGGGYGFSYENVAPDGQRQRVFYPDQTPPQEGERITVQGWVNVLVAVADGRVEALLHGRSQGITFELSGPVLEELAEAGGAELQVQGSIVDLRESGLPVLEVESWQPAEPDAGPSSCVTGEFARDGDRALLQSDDGDTFDLGAVDPDLTGGERIEVCAESFEEGQVVAWNHIVTPPSSELQGGSGGGGASGTVVEAAETVEVTRVIESGSAEGGTGRQVAEQVVAGGPDATSPYEIGEAVEVTGNVGGYLRREGEEVVPYLILGIDHDGDPLTYDMHYPIYGDREALLALSDHSRLYVGVQGTVVEASGELQGPDGQAILLESFEPPAESQGIQSFLGHLERETLDGREVTVLVDGESGDRYVLNQDFGMMQDIEGTIWAAGVVHPDAEVGGLPVLALYSTRSGSDVDAAESAADIQMEEAMQVVEEEPASRGTGLPQTLIVERVELAYSYDNPTAMGGETLTPTWLFHGRSPDGLSTFVLRLDATQ